MHRQLVLRAGIVIDGSDLLDGIAQTLEVVEDRDDVVDDVLMHHELTSMRAAVEAEVVELDAAQ